MRTRTHQSLIWMIPRTNRPRRELPRASGDTRTPYQELRNRQPRIEQNEKGQVHRAPDEKRKQMNAKPTVLLAQKASKSLNCSFTLHRSHAHSCCFSFHLANKHCGRAVRRRPRRKHTCCNAESPAARYLHNLCLPKSRRRDRVRNQRCQPRVDLTETQKRDRL